MYNELRNEKLKVFVMLTSAVIALGEYCTGIELDTDFPSASIEHKTTATRKCFVTCFHDTIAIALSIGAMILLHILSSSY